MSVEQIERIGEALQILVDIFGPGWTVLLILGIVVLAGLWRVYMHRRVDRGFKAALDEKERTVQRLANEARGWRILFLTKVLRMSKQEAEKIIERNEFATPAEARETLEQRRRYERSGRKKKGKRKRQ